MIARSTEKVKRPIAKIGLGDRCRIAASSKLIVVVQLVYGRNGFPDMCDALFRL